MMTAAAADDETNHFMIGDEPSRNAQGFATHIEDVDAAFLEDVNDSNLLGNKQQPLNCSTVTFDSSDEEDSSQSNDVVGATHISTLHPE
jgi:hypothetical protein